MYDTTPILVEALYDKRGTSIPAVLELYEEKLLNVGSIASISHATRIKLYREEILNKKYLYELRQNFNNIYSLIDKQIPELRFSIEGRRKSLLSTDKKIQKNLNEGKSLDLIRDTNGFRIILFGNSSQELLKVCYDIMNSIIEFEIKQGFTLCDADRIKDNPNALNEHPEIWIPKKSGIEKQFLYGIKDYILNPKENGYQSIHAIFRRPKGGECFEIQIRTFDMHVYAESGEAKHSTYKTNKYKNGVSFDRTKIRIPGYGVSTNGEIFDFIGLEESLQILKRQKTF